MAPSHRMRVAAALGTVYIVWGATYLAILWAVETMPPLVMAGARHLVAGAILYAVAAARGAAPPTRVHWRSAAIVGALLLLGGNGGVSWAEQRVPSGLSALVIATVPLWMVAVHWFSAEGRRTTRPRVFLGVLVGLAGIALLVDPRAGDRVDPLGAIVLVGAALSWSVGSLYARRAPLPPDKFQGIAMELLAGGAILVAVGLAMGEGARLDLAAVSTRSWLSWVFLVFLGSLVGYTAYLWVLGHVAPAVASTYAYVNPVVAVVLGVAFAGETLTVRTGVAGLIILAAVVLITLTPAARPQPPPAAPAPAETE